MNQPELSVVVCAYNEAERVEDCVRALLAQDLASERFEVVFVDDGSEDDTLDLVRHVLAAERRARDIVFRVVSIEHAGLCWARNTGIVHTRGKLIAFTDADAAPDKDWARRIVERFDADASLDVLGGRVRIINPESRVARFLDMAHYGAADERDVIGCNMVFRRELFERFGGFHVGFASRGDETELLMRFGTSARVEKDLGLWVEHERPESLFGWLRERRANGRFYAWGERLTGRMSKLGRLRDTAKRIATLVAPIAILLLPFLAGSPSGMLIAAALAAPGTFAIARRLIRGGRVGYLFHHSRTCPLPNKWSLRLCGTLGQLAGDTASDIGWLKGAFEEPGPRGSSCCLISGQVASDESFGPGPTPVREEPKAASPMAAAPPSPAFASTGPRWSQDEDPEA